MALSRTPKNQVLNLEHYRSRVQSLNKALSEERAARESVEQYRQEDMRNAFKLSKQVVINRFKDEIYAKEKLIAFYEQLVENDIISNCAKKYQQILSEIITDEERKEKLDAVDTTYSSLEYEAVVKTLGFDGIFSKHPEFKKYCNINTKLTEIIELDNFGYIKDGYRLEINTATKVYQDYLICKAVNGIAVFLLRNPDFLPVFIGCDLSKSA